MSYLLRNLTAVLAFLALILPFATSDSSSGIAIAASEGWSHLGGPPGRVAVLAVASSNPRELYAVTGSTLRPASALYKSTDGGENWQPITNDFAALTINDLAVHPIESSIVYAATNNGIYRSTDGGYHWLRVMTGEKDEIDARVVRFAPNDPRFIYVLIVEKTRYPASFVYRSSDGGRTWASVRLQTYPGSVPYSLVVDPQIPTTVYASTFGHIYKSMDGGTSWAVADGEVVVNGQARALAIDPRDSNTIYAAGKDEENRVVVHKSTNGGGSWSRASELGRFDLDFVTSLLVSRNLPGTLYLGRLSGLYMSRDGGVSWVLFGPGNTGIHAISLDYTAMDNLYLATGNGIYNGSAAGSWRSIDRGLPANSRLWSIATSPKRPQVIFVGTQPVEGAGAAGILKSTDGGKTWAPANLGLADQSVTDIAIDPVDPDTVYAATFRGLFKSSDDGGRWVRLAVNPTEPGQSVYSVAVDPTNSAVIYAGSVLWIYKSTDRGTTWNRVSGPPVGPATVTRLAIDPRNPSTVYACATRVYKSADGGAAWEPAGGEGAPSCRNKALALDPINPNNVYVSGKEGVFKSTDGGHTWTPANQGLPAGYSVTALLVDPRASHIIYAAGEGGGVYRSTDMAATWVDIGNSLGDNKVTALATDYSGQGEVYAATDSSGIWRFGSSWNPPSTPKAVDARIEIVWPHDRDGRQQPVTEAPRANVGVRLFLPNSLELPPCSWSPRVRLWASINNEPPSLAGTGVQRTWWNQPIPFWDFNDLDVSLAMNPDNKIYFFVTVDGVETRTSVWTHGADARTIFPQQEVPWGVGRISEADTRIQIVWPHDEAGRQRPVAEAPLVNLGVDIFEHGTLMSAPPEGDPVVKLYRSLNNGGLEFVARGQKQLVLEDNVVHPRWVFDNIDVSAAVDPLNKYFFQALVEGITTYPGTWSHGADARTVFPIVDEPVIGCR